jgi:hypothetical protein
MISLVRQLAFCLYGLDEPGEVPQADAAVAAPSPPVTGRQLSHRRWTSPARVRLVTNATLPP